MDTGCSPDSGLVKGMFPTPGPSAGCSDEALAKCPSPTFEPVPCRGPASVPNPGSSSDSCLCPGLGEDVFWDSGCDLGPGSATCSDTGFHSGWGTGGGGGFGSALEPGVEALMLGAAVWHDRQGTTVNSDESPRERPPQPPPRHRATAFPIEPADRSAAGPSRGEGAAGGGGGGGAGGFASARARRRRARVPRRCRSPVPPAPAGCCPARAQPEGLDSGVSLASPAPGSGSGTWKARWKHLWGQSLEGGRREGTASGHRPCLRPNPCQAPG